VGSIHYSAATVKRGQITLFLIVGIVILFVIGGSIYIFSALQPQQVLGGPLTEESTECLERASTQAITEMLRVGGIRDSEDHAVSIVTDRALWPQEYLAGYHQYGNYSYKPLCLYDGENRPNANLDNSTSCMTGTYQLFEQNTDVLQYALERNIEQNLITENCTQRGAVKVLLGGEDVVVRVENQTARIPVRFKKLFNAAYRITNEEMTNLDFNMDVDSKTVLGCPEPLYGNKCILPGMDVKTEHKGEYAHITITDAKSLIYSDPVALTFEIQNRHPVRTQLLSPGQNPIAVEHYHPGFGSPTQVKTPMPDPDEEIPTEIKRCQLYLGAEPPDDYEDTYKEWIECSAAKERGVTMAIIEFSPECHTPRPSGAANFMAGKYIAEFCTQGLCNNFTGEVRIDPMDPTNCRRDDACIRWQCPRVQTCPPEPADLTSPEHAQWEIDDPICQAAYQRALQNWNQCMDDCRIAYGTDTW
jgi:hypothetical protein